MIRENDYIAVFQSIHRVMKAEKLLKAARIDILLIPAPRQIGSDCGLALRYTPDLQQAVSELLQEHSLVPSEIYQYREGIFHRNSAASAE